MRNFNQQFLHFLGFVVSLCFVPVLAAAPSTVQIPYQNTNVICACQCNAGANSSGYLCPVPWTETVGNAPCDSAGLIMRKCIYVYTCPSGFNVAAPADGNCAALSGMACSGTKHPMAPGGATSGALECTGGPTVVPAPPPTAPPVPPTQPAPNPVNTTIPNPWMPTPKPGPTVTPPTPRPRGR